MAYTMFSWSTDDNDKPIVNIDNKVYTHEQVVKLRDELNELLSYPVSEVILKDSEDSYNVWWRKNLDSLQKEYLDYTNEIVYAGLFYKTFRSWSEHKFSTLSQDLKLEG